jgi:CRISPR/Cas system CSM-associated protein Csm3 (group 7 of RAMP superfamily)
MNFVRTDHAQLGKTVFLPGSSLKGTMRSYAEKIARTLAEGYGHMPPLSCNPLARSDRPGDQYNCGYAAEQKKLEGGTAVHAHACPICRTFGNTTLAAHLRQADAYPQNPLLAEDADLFHQTNHTSPRDGVAIDRISGSVAHGPFTLEVVTQGAFYTSFTLHNFQLWQLGLLAIVLRDIGQGRVPIGFARSRGLGRMEIEYLSAEIGYPARFSSQEGAFDFAANVYDVGQFMQPTAVDAYKYHPVKQAIAMPAGAELVEDGSYGRIATRLTGEQIDALWRASVPYWANFVQGWQQQEAAHVS